MPFPFMLVEPPLVGKEFYVSNLGCIGGGSIPSVVKDYGALPLYLYRNGKTRTKWVFDRIEYGYYYFNVYTSSVCVGISGYDETTYNEVRSTDENRYPKDGYLEPVDEHTKWYKKIENS